MKRRTRRTILLIFILITAVSSYYFVEYSYNEEFKKLTELNKKQTNKLFDNKTPEEVLKEIKIKIDTLEKFIIEQNKVIPYYASPVKAYDEILKIINLFENKLFVNIDKLSSEDKNPIRIDRFKVTGEGEFRNLFSLINLFESAPELYLVRVKEIKQTFVPNPNSRLDEKVLFTFELETYYTLLPEYNLDTLTKRDKKVFLTYISDYFKPLIKLDIPPNDEGLFEVDGSKLIAIMPDAVYLVDKKGNSHTLSEGDEVYLGYLTKINYEKYSCEFLLNKGGILERVTLLLEEKEEKK